MNVAPLHNHLPVAIVGGGQAGLSMSYCLKEQGIDHLVFERNRIAHEWREHRWDSFCLVTPNWQCDLPGFPYPGDDPKGFMLKDEIVQYLENYAASFNPPLREGVSVTRVRQLPGGQFSVATSIGEFTADQVVVATGGYHTAAIPRMAERLPATIKQLHSSAYRNPQSLPDGPVLVIGTGQSGCQIAEDLHREGVQVHLSVGSAPRSPRKYRGKDAIEWLHDSGYYAIGFEDHPQKETVREKTNHYMTGRDGGREIDLRVFASEGMKLYGRVKSLQESTFEFADDLKKNLDHADAVAESIKTTIDRFIESQNIDAPLEAPYQPCWQPETGMQSLDLAAAGIRTIIWCVGFDTNFRWVEVPVFDGRGEPVHRRGVTAVDGLYFLGLPWMHTWGSGRFSGVGLDAKYLTQCMQERAELRAMKSAVSGEAG